MSESSPFLITFTLHFQMELQAQFIFYVDVCTISSNFSSYPS